VDLKFFATVFATIFVAELGDKTQIATVLYASQSAHPRMTVFMAAASALVLATAIAVLAGEFIAQYVSERIMTRLAGAGFIAIGLWTLWLRPE